MNRSSEAVDFIVHTSVDDGLRSARNAKPTEIAQAIAYERQNGKRKALIAGLERELRRRQKAKS